MIDNEKSIVHRLIDLFIHSQDWITVIGYYEYVATLCSKREA